VSCSPLPQVIGGVNYAACVGPASPVSPAPAAMVTAATAAADLVRLRIGVPLPVNRSEATPRHISSNMSPQNHLGEISLYQVPPYVIHLQTVWRPCGDGMETHRFSVPADGDQDDLITLEDWHHKAWQRVRPSLTLKRQRPTQAQQEGTATLPTDIDLIRPVQAFELRQRPRSTSMQLVHTEEVTGSIPVSPTDVKPVQTLR
jgi:hypothetical protein